MRRGMMRQYVSVLKQGKENFALLLQFFWHTQRSEEGCVPLSSFINGRRLAEGVALGYPTILGRTR